MSDNNSSPYLPIYLDLRQVHVLIVGGGRVAFEKYATLSDHGADVTFVSPDFNSLFEGMVDGEKLHFIKKSYEKEDLKGYGLIYVAVDSPELSEQIWLDTREHSALVNFVDQKERCNFISPAIYKDESFSIAVSTGGTAPGAASALRNRIRQVLPAEEANAIVKEGKESRGLVNTDGAGKSFVYFVGAGAGRLEDLSGEALRALSRAHVVLHDHYLEGLKDHFPRAKWIPVGKKRGEHSLRQEEINEELCNLVTQGFVVVRLKAGDIFLYARLNEEIAALNQLNFKSSVGYKLIPGLSSWQLLARELGISITERGVINSVQFIASYTEEPFTTTADACFVYMGLKQLPKVIQSLLKSGFSPDSPLIAASHLGRPWQRIMQSTLARAVTESGISTLPSPVLLFASRNGLHL